MSATTGGDDLWTTGQAAEYLSDLGISRRQVSRMLDSGELAGVRRGPGTWGRVRASGVRELRARLLAQEEQRRRSAAGNPPPQNPSGDGP